MDVAGRSDAVEGSPEDWAAVKEIVRRRRDELGLNQVELAARSAGEDGRPMASRNTVTDMERATKARYRRRSVIGMSRALGWEDDAIENYLRDRTVPQPRRPDGPEGAGTELQAIRASLAEIKSAISEVADLLVAIAERFGLR